MLKRLALVSCLTTGLILSQAPANASAAPVPAALVAAPHSTPVELNVTPGLYSATQLSHVLDLAVKAHASSIYSVVNWPALAPRAARRYQWDSLDRLSAMATARHLGLRFQLTGTPDWLHPSLVRQGIPGDKRRMTPPQTATELKAFLLFTKDVAARYKNSVSRLEIWNEPNEKTFFQPTPSPARYAQVLKAGYTGVRMGAPRSQVLFGGISRNDLGFLSKVYAAIDAIPGHPANHYFDTLDVHPYSGNRGPTVNSSQHVWNAAFGPMDENFLGLIKMKALMTAHHEGTKHIFLGEYGFSTKSNQWTAAVPDTTRATYLQQAYRLAGTLPYVDGMNWYSLMGNQWDDPSWTLLSSTGRPTATYNALVALRG